MINAEKKPESKPVSKKRFRKPSVDFEKIFLEAMNDVAEIVEEAPIRVIRPMIARKFNRVRLEDRILHAESWPERDRLLRSLARKCYALCNFYLNQGELETALKWMKLVCRFLGLSFTPAKLQDLEQIKKELTEVKAQMEEEFEGGGD